MRPVVTAAIAMALAVLGAQSAAYASAASAPAASAAQAREPVAENPQIDYAAFTDLVVRLGPVREAHRLAWNDWLSAARQGSAIVLDTRSAEAFARGHIRGAVNLPFSDFTDSKLRSVLGDNPRRAIFIYCNNNFRDDRPPVPLKRAPLALNIPTFVNLHGYGYTNVWELADALTADELGADWVATPQASS